MDYRGRPEFNESWGNATRRIHISNLAKPHPRRLRPYPDPMYYQPVPTPIPKEIMEYKPSKRIELLSIPLETKKTTKYEPKLSVPSTVEPAALLYKPTKRLHFLAKPKQSLREKKRQQKRKELSKKDKEKLSSSLQGRGEWLSKNAMPKKYPPDEHKHPSRPRYVFIGTRKIKIPERKSITKYTTPNNNKIEIDNEEMLRHLEVLAVPTRRREKYVDIIAKRAQEEPKIVPKASARVEELALPRQLADEALLDLKYQPYKVSRAAMKYTASERINTLATPVTKTKKIDTDVKEDPFGVSKAALKAVCSKRVQELAKPVIKE